MNNAANRPEPTPIPWQARLLGRVIHPIYRFFDWLYGSGYSPLYRSGTLAVGFLFVLLGTGLYLSFFYSVSEPYESVQTLQNQAWLGRWIRALHRYATVATILAIVFHILQLLVQGKTWGARTLAWLSGIILLLMFFVSAWSGYVMVWDLHGQKIALAGAEMLGVFPIVHDVVGAAFNGTSEVPPGFFFMNLFMHVAVPVGMIMFLWVHTARLSRSVWFPIRPIMIYASVALLGLAILWPAPLLEKADLLRLIGKIPIEISTGFWIPWIETITAEGVWIVLLIGTLIIAWVPWWWRPGSQEMRPTSSVDVAACTGCTQCAADCPYEAIKMVPRQDGKRLVAEIIPHHCVSCGICAASCADFAIGPAGRTAVDQHARVEQFCAEAKKNGKSFDLVLIACTNNSRLAEVLNSYIELHPAVALYEVECCGCMHTDVLEQLLTISKGLALIGCPARNCFNRDGGDLLAERIFEKRVPFLDRSIDRSRLLITTFSEAESDKVHRALSAFHLRLNGSSVVLPGLPKWSQRSRALGATLVLLILCAFLAQVPIGSDSKVSIVRVAGLLSSSMSEQCHVPTHEEVKDLPLHMRPKEICLKVPLEYQVEITIDEQLVSRTIVKDKSGRVDRPLYLDIDAEVLPGMHNVKVEIFQMGVTTARCAKNITLAAGQIFLAQNKRELEGLYCE